MFDYANYIADVNPTHPLASIPNPASHAHSEGRQHLGKGAAVTAEDHAKSRIHRANARLRRGLRGRLPLATDFREKVIPRSAFLAQDFVAPIAVISDCGRTDEHSRRRRGFSQRFRQVSRSLQAAIADSRLLSWIPSSGNSFTGKVNDSAESFQLLGSKRPGRVPSNLIISRDRAPHQSSSPSAFLQYRQESLADWPGSSANQISCRLRHSDKCSIQGVIRCSEGSGIWSSICLSLRERPQTRSCVRSRDPDIICLVGYRVGSPFPLYPEAI
jgi:hypothetical protein